MTETIVEGQVDKARLFVELTADGLAAFRQELAERSVPNRNSWWGYDVIQVDDPDGNELLFPFPTDRSSASAAHLTRKAGCRSP